MCRAIERGKPMKGAPNQPGLNADKCEESSCTFYACSAGGYTGADNKMIYWICKILDEAIKERKGHFILPDDLFELREKEPLCRNGESGQKLCATTKKLEDYLKSDNDDCPVHPN